MKGLKLPALLDVKEFLQRQNHAGYCTFLRIHPYPSTTTPYKSILRPLLFSSWKGAETCGVLPFYELRDGQNGIQFQAFLGPVPAR